jgi:valyl-tRNA synthetase
MENIKDWCISRQLWWGHRIPAWYDDQGKVVVAADLQEAQEEYKKLYGSTPTTLHQDEDCLDTWFSSWLWPFEVFKGYSQPGNKEVAYYYPTNTLVTAPEIIFFWVARMIMAGCEFQQQIPFRQVYFTGIVRDKQGRKMSKSLGNSPDLLALLDQYGADAVRFGIMIASPAGNDLLWDESTNEQGLHFNNKIWNALKLVRSWEQRQSNESTLSTPSFAIDWFESRLQQARITLEELYGEYKLSEALKTIYSLIWDDFCSWYLEWVKPGFEQPIASVTYKKTLTFFEELMQLLHPFMPFITEEVFHQLQPREEDLTVRPLTTPTPFNAELLSAGELLKQMISAVRDARNKNQLKPKEPVKLHIESETPSLIDSITPLLSKQINATSVHSATTIESVANSITVVVGKQKIFIETTTLLDTSTQKEKLLKDLDYLKGFLASVDKKLSNEKFVQNANPTIIENEKKKKADALTKIRLIEESLQALL